jgi:hypothetical protein
VASGQGCADELRGANVQSWFSNRRHQASLNNDASVLACSVHDGKVGDDVGRQDNA